MSKSGKILLYGSLFSLLYISSCIFLYKDNLIEKKKIKKQREELDVLEDNIPTPQMPIQIEIPKREIAPVATPQPTLQKQEEQLDIESIQNEISQTLLENKISFYRGSRHIKKDSKKTLDEIAQILKELDVYIIVKGYTDASGSATMNKALSLKRAEAVKRYLQSKGVNPDNIQAVGFGEEDLIDRTNPYSPINRRVEIEIRR
jgi:outer membrane protein OmpA-like peptidoglycan-associated protein